MQLTWARDKTTNYGPASICEQQSVSQSTGPEPRELETRGSERFQSHTRLLLRLRKAAYDILVGSSCEVLNGGSLIVLNGMNCGRTGASEPQLDNADLPGWMSSAVNPYGG